MDPKPGEVLLDPLIDLGYRGLHIRACVLVSQDESPIVHLRVLVTEDDGFCAPQVEGSIGIGSESCFDHLELLDVLEWREGLLLLFLLLGFEEFRPSLLEH